MEPRVIGESYNRKHVELSLTINEYGPADITHVVASIDKNGVVELTSTFSGWVSASEDGAGHYGEVQRITLPEDAVKALFAVYERTVRELNQERDANKLDELPPF